MLISEELSCSISRLSTSSSDSDSLRSRKPPIYWIPTEFDWLRFLDNLSSQTPTDPGKNLVPTQSDYYFVITCHSRWFIQYCVFLIDLNAESNLLKYPIPPLDPLIRFSCGHQVFVILGTKLYMIAGTEFEGEREFWSKKMSIYDMTTPLFSGTTISLSKEGEEVLLTNIDNLENGPEMAAGKRWPCFVVLSSYKICVFSSRLYLDSHGSSYAYLDPFDQPFFGPNFEVYDTTAGSWAVLPEICEYDKLVVVESYTAYQSSLIIQTTLGIYGINVDNPNPKWLKMFGSESLRKFPLRAGWTMVDKQLFNHIKLVQRGGLSECPFEIKKSTTDRESLIVESHTSFLCFGGVNHGNILVRGGLHSSRYFGYRCAPPSLLVDTFKFDGECVTSDSCEALEIQSHKSFNFALNSTPSIRMSVIGCFPLKGMNTTSLDASNDYIWQKIQDGFHWVDLANKLTSECGQQSLSLANSQINGATGNGSFKRHAVGLPSRFRQVLLSLLG